MPRAGLNPEVLARAAAELADEEGLEAVTVSGLARRVGVRPASLYSHVAGTTDLRLRVALLALEETAALAADAVAGRSGRDALVALADVHRDYARARPGCWAASQLRLPAELVVGSAGPRHAELTRAVLRGYDVPPADEVAAVRLLGSVLRGYPSLELGGGFDHSEPDSETTWRRALDALDVLLRAWPR